MAQHERAFFFVDGNNWYHSLREAGVVDLMELDYPRIFAKLSRPREWLKAIYYIGQMQQEHGPEAYANQRRFLSRITKDDQRIEVRFGRMEVRKTRNDAVAELASCLARTTTRLEPALYQELQSIVRRHREAKVLVEKAVDVHLAVEMVLNAERDAFDTAYLLSADGDFTPAVEAVRRHGKKVHVVSCGPGARLKAAANSYIRPDKAWFSDCYQRTSRQHR